MTNLEALTIVDGATGIAKLTRGDHVQVQQAMAVLNRLVKSVAEEKKTEETPPKGANGRGKKSRV